MRFTNHGPLAEFVVRASNIKAAGFSGYFNPFPVAWDGTNQDKMRLQAGDHHDLNVASMTAMSIGASHTYQVNLFAALSNA